MRSHTMGAAALILSAAFLAGCSKTDKTVEATPAVAVDATADAATTATDPGGAVSPLPANGNEAINPDANTGDAATSAASNSFTEGQARGHIENAGYSDVTGLTKTADGLWTGVAKKAGKAVTVSVDFKGAVTAK